MCWMVRIQLASIDDASFPACWPRRTSCCAVMTMFIGEAPLLLTCARANAARGGAARAAASRPSFVRIRILWWEPARVLRRRHTALANTDRPSRRTVIK